METWLAENGKSALRFQISRSTNSPFYKITDLNCSVQGWTDGDLSLGVTGNNLCLCLLDWSVDGQNMRISPIVFPLSWFFKRIILWSYQIESFQQGLQRDVFRGYWVLCTNYLFHVRSMFYPSGWRIISYFDSGSIFFWMNFYWHYVITFEIIFSEDSTYLLVQFPSG